MSRENGKTLRVEPDESYVTSVVISSMSAQKCLKKGCEAYGDQHPRFGFPNGANDTEELRDYFQVLKEEGFFRRDNPLVLSMGVKPWKDEEAEIVLAGTKRVVNRAWALVED